MATYTYAYLLGSDGSTVRGEFGVNYYLADGTYAISDTLNPTSTSSTSIVGRLSGYSGDGFVIDTFVGPVFYTNTPYATSDTVGPFASEGTFTTCFLAGTHIATPEGERRVEDLAVGELVLTAAGETRPVRWIGRQSVMRMFADPLANYPIRVAAGALSDNAPVRDLFVSPDHALLIDGLLVQAGALVNGTSIARVERPEERFTYYHIELEDHALVLAEGVPAETFVDNVTRRRFDNYAEFEELHGAGASVPELDLPRVKSARQLPAALRARLEARAGRGAAVA
ncbi:Hint domain-containing protein [Ancylobacter sp. Lp-2]|uniref:Hint domain-containing protein n=1 Tax=Ancylobacter sp. Lp-2 TaxID=2881339 RepID=UPI001E5BEC0E|nr:Hint domain-containing protein [Ancylobacter sp. Lp-2]MCB4771493.1 Hint domain-containing protein [Ancylobacter sp. Lp-2]